MKIKGTLWLTHAPRVGMHMACIGIVYGEDDHTGERKAYIGAASGVDEASDAMDIAECGTKIQPEDIKILNEFLTKGGSQ